ncbi:hypothetical protein AVEN_235352-1 [Araneus ventricosus]|uniref:Uncharacterized protein n=1 Tax=Araneus ventricosus TaxID=182803 RepID=A0A4Y2A635_ARAVE|nr:hypothetical protein AVEN_235352-1 [Araneus ventricosus]
MSNMRHAGSFFRLATGLEKMKSLAKFIQVSENNLTHQKRKIIIDCVVLCAWGSTREPAVASAGAPLSDSRVLLQLSGHILSTLYVNFA